MAEEACQLLSLTYGWEPDSWQLVDSRKGLRASIKQVTPSAQARHGDKPVQTWDMHLSVKQTRLIAKKTDRSPNE